MCECMCVCVRMCVSVYVCAHVCECVCVSAYAYVCTCMCASVYELCILCVALRKHTLNTHSSSPQFFTVYLYITVQHQRTWPDLCVHSQKRVDHPPLIGR